MLCPKCGFIQPKTSLECPRCGIIFAKLKTHAEAAVTAPANRQEDEPTLLIEEEAESVFHQLFLHLQSDINPFYWGGRILVWLTLFVWGWTFILASIDSNMVGSSFLHGVNLVFHEAGHIIFSPFGKFITTLGGSLGQILMPFICLIVFLIKTRDPFGGSVALWWMGQNFMDIAPYINDARSLKLILLGGVTGKETVDYHDWEFLLRRLHMLQWDHALARMSHGMGSILMLIAFTWGALILWRQYPHLQKN